jgi:hypothetical protein
MLVFLLAHGYIVYLSVKCYIKTKWNREPVVYRFYGESMSTQSTMRMHPLALSVLAVSTELRLEWTILLPQT